MKGRHRRAQQFSLPRVVANARIVRDKRGVERRARSAKKKKPRDIARGFVIGTVRFQVQ
jgi:hypothetical protein